MNATSPVEQHVDRLNDAIGRGDFDGFLATFAPEAVMRFEGVPGGPYVGRDAIAAAYAADPPDDTMRVVSTREVAGGTLVRFRWDRGGGGFFVLGLQDGLVVRLDVSFLPEAESAWSGGWKL